VPFNEKRHRQQYPLGPCQGCKKTDHSGKPPFMLAHIVERGDRQHEEQRFSIDRRKEYSGRKDRYIENRSTCHGTIILMFEQFIEKEQPKEKRDIRDKQPCNEVIPNHGSEHTYQPRIQREEGHVRALIALRRYI